MLRALALFTLLTGCVSDDVRDDEIVEPDDKADGVACRATRASVEAAAVSTMRAAGLIRPGEEQDLDGFVTKWGLDRVTSYRGTCLAVMTPCYFDNGEAIGCEPSAFEILAYTKTGTTVEATTFESKLPAPETLRVALGGVSADFDPNTNLPLPNLPTDLYYVELDAASALAAMKSIRAKAHYCGFGGFVIPGGKASFDPTPDRTWRVVEPKFDLRRGNSHEVGDIRPSQLDGDFATYYGGSIRRPIVVDGATVEGAEVMPWGACFVRRYELEGRWIDVLKKPI